jgi:hypothetical protein
MKPKGILLLAGLGIALAVGQTVLRLQPDQAFVCAPNAIVRQCAGPNVTAPGGLPSDCTGLYHIHVFTASGKTYEITGTIDNTTDTTTAQWTPAP